MKTVVITGASRGIGKAIAEKFAKEAADRMIEAGNKYVTKVNMDVDVNITEVWQK